MNDASFARHWFMHTPHAVIGMGGRAGVPPPASGCPGDAQIVTGNPLGAVPPVRLLRVGVVAGWETEWETAARAVAEHFNRDSGVLAERAWDQPAADAADDDYDCLVLLGWPAADDHQRLKRIELYCRDGRPLVALRTLDAELPGWPDFTEEVFGGRQPGTRSRVARRSRLLEVLRSDVGWHHPAVDGVEILIAEGEVYRGPRLSPRATVLLTADDGRGPAPVAWAMRRGPASGCPGRVFCSTLGHEDDFQQPAFLRLLSNAVHWAVRAR